MGRASVQQDRHVGFAPLACAIRELNVLSSWSSVGAPENELGNEGAVGLPRARAPHSHRSLGRRRWGGTTLLVWQQGASQGMSKLDTHNKRVKRYPIANETRLQCATSFAAKNVVTKKGCKHNKSSRSYCKD